MKKNDTLKDKMLTKIWEMKEKTYNETKNMDCGKFFNYVNSKAEKLKILNKKLANINNS